MRHISDVIGRKDVQPHQAAIIAEFFNVVALWKAGNVSVTDADALTGDGWLRAQVIRSVSPDHAQYADAMALLDAIIDVRSPDVYKTDFGFFTLNEIEHHGGSVHDRLDSATGEYTQIVEFPDPPIDEEHPVWRPEPHREYPASPYEAEWNGQLDTEERQE